MLCFQCNARGEETPKNDPFLVLTAKVALETSVEVRGRWFGSALTLPLTRNAMMGVQLIGCEFPGLRSSFTYSDQKKYESAARRTLSWPRYNIYEVSNSGVKHNG